MPSPVGGSPPALERQSAFGKRADAERHGLTGRAFRFVAVGGVVAVLYVAVTTLLALVGVPFQAALVLGFATAVAAHFTLQRVFVWVHDDGYALPLHRQAGRYISLAAAQYGVTSVATLVLPAVLGVGVLYVYIPTAVVVAAVSFLVMRTRVFHPAEPG